MTGLKIGFLNNQLDNRGTGNALFDYAHYNEEILGNKSTILVRNPWNVDPQMDIRIHKRFRNVWPYQGEERLTLDVLYHIKSGGQDGFVPPEGVRYVVHAVFDFDPHADRYAVVSPWMARQHNTRFVPHIVNLPESTENLRVSLEIGQTSVVFGRHGGADSFDIPFAWSAINRALIAREDIYFLFMNTNKPDIVFADPNRVIFLPSTADPLEKRKFINTCDAMIHARGRGETFGIAVGEFASLGKPVITYGLSPERNHLEEVMCYTYNNEDELYWHLVENEWLTQDKSEHWLGYTQYTPENVMAQFKEIFLD